MSRRHAPTRPRTTRRAAVALALPLVLVHCGTESGTRQQTGARSSAAAPLTSSAARAARLRTQQLDAGRAFAIDPIGVGANPPHGMSLRFDADRVRVAHGDERLAVQVDAIGRAATLAPFEPLRRTIDGARVDYVGRDARVWYRNGPLGIEQGLDVESRPAGDGPLLVDVSLGGAEPHAVPGGVDVGSIAVRELSAEDATGRPLSAQLVVHAHALRFVIDDRDARYPIAIDPFYSVNGKIPADTAGLGTSISYRDNTMIVGSPLEQIGGKANHGSARVFVRSGATWTQQATLAITDGVAEGKFGTSVWFDASKNLAVVGCPGCNGAASGSGAVYLARRSGSSWAPDLKIYPSGGATGDRFGTAIALVGSLLVVGAPGRSSGGGAAYVFTASGSFPLVANFTGSGSLGRTVATNGTQVVVGAPDENQATQGGNVHWYSNPGSGWVKRGLFDPGTRSGYAGYGSAIDMSGSTVVIGAPIAGRVHTFVLDPTNGPSQRQFLVSPVSLAQYGSAVAVDGTRIAVGASGAGNVVVFDKGAGTWGHIFTVKPTDGKPIGRSVDAQGTLVVSGGDSSVYSFDVLATQATGTTCTTDAQCTTGFCTEGVCCSARCNGPCESCLASVHGSATDGTCAPVKSDTDPKDKCPTDPGFPTSCKGDGLCDGAGNCRPYAKAGVSCGTTTCSASTVTGPSCDGSGACDSTPKSCGDYGCKDAASCATSCATTADCAGDRWCDTGVCRPKKANGAFAATPEECTSGLVADTVCCDTTCTGACQACTAVKKGSGADGTCGFVAAESDPDVECAKASCDLTTLVPAQVCDGVGACKSKPSKDCAPFACAPEGCRAPCEGDTDCAPQKTCVSGACVAPSANDAGVDVPVTSCTKASDCASGHCASGVCCDSDCTEACHSCALPGSRGRCSLVPFGLDPRRECGTPGSCQATCSGDGACVAAIAGSECAPSRCTGPNRGLGPARCAAPGAACQESASTPFECGPYACMPAVGECATQCSGSNDCAPSHTCDTSLQQCVPSAAVEDEGGCAMEHLGRGGAHGWLAVACLVLVGASTRRRRTGTAR